MNLEQVIDGQIAVFAKRLYTSSSTLLVPSGSYLGAFTSKWTVPLQQHKDTSDVTIGLSFYMLMLKYEAKNALYDVWTTGEDIMYTSRLFLFWRWPVVAIQRQGIVAVVAAEGRRLEEVQSLAEEFCSAVLTWLNA